MDPTPEVASFSSISALLAALAAALGGTVLLGGRRRTAYQSFLVLSANLFFWHLFSIFRTSPRLSLLALLALTVLPLSLGWFLRTWLSESMDAQLRRVPRAAVLLVFAVEVGLVYAYTARSAGGPRWAIRLPELVKALVPLALLGALSPLWLVYRSTVSRVDKRRLLYLLGLGAITVLAATIDHQPPPLGRGGAAYGSLLTVVYLYFLQQTLFMDRLLDIDELLGKVVVMSAFVLLLSAVHTALNLTNVDQRQAVTVVAVIILLLYEPLRSFLEGQVQRFTARERYELQQALADLRQALPNIIEPREAVRLVLSVFEETRRLTQASVYLLDPVGSGYELSGYFGPRPVDRLDAAARRPLLARLVSTRQPLMLEQLRREELALKPGSAAESENLTAIARTLVELQAGAVLGIYAGLAPAPTGSPAPLSPTHAGPTGKVGESRSPSAPLGEAARRAATASGAIPAASGASASLGIGARTDAQDAGVPGVALLGLLCVNDGDGRDAFAAGELEVYAGLAAQLGITIQNSKLYERMKERDRLAALGKMAAGLAHEIRNPLGAIKGAAELITPTADGHVPEDAGEFVGIILEETRRLGRVVSQFLDYARPFRGDFHPLDINEVLKKTIGLLRPLSDELFAGRSAPVIALDLAPGLPSLRGDADQLRQVFLNLALNALQAIAEAPPRPRSSSDPATDELGSPPMRLLLATSLRHGGRLGAAAQHIEVRFEDSGPGLDPKVIPNLFIPFYTTKERGTGLGLAISQRITENHGGFIEAKNRVEGGAVFTVVLPVSE